MRTIDDLVSQIAQVTGKTAVHIKTENKPQIKTEKTAEVTPAVVTVENNKTIGMRPTLTLALAKEIVYCVERGAEMMGVDAVISVVNDSGNLVAFEAMDNSLPISVRASQEKAYTAAVMKMPTHVALEKSRGGDFDGLTNGGGILLLGGGYPLEYDGISIGAVGVSGGTKEQDITLAKIGVGYLNERIKTVTK